MDFVSSRCCVGFFLFILPLAAEAQKARTAEEAASIEHAREELGINEFTAPSIGLLFRELDELRPIPFEKVWRDLPDTTSEQARAHLVWALLNHNDFVTLR